MAELTKEKIEKDCYLYDDSGNIKSKFTEVPWFIKWRTERGNEAKKIIDSNQFYDRLGVQSIYCDVQFRIGNQPEDWISLNSLNRSYTHSQPGEDVSQNNFIINLQTENEGVEKVKIELLDSSYEIIDHLLSIAVAFGQPNPTAPEPTIEWIENNVDGTTFNSDKDRELYTKYSEAKTVYDGIINRLRNGDSETVEHYRLGFGSEWRKRVESDDFTKLNKQSQENIILTEFPGVLEEKQKVTTAALNLANFRLKKFGLMEDKAATVTANLRYRFGYADANPEIEGGTTAEKLGFSETDPGSSVSSRWTESTTYNPSAQTAAGDSVSRSAVLFSNKLQTAFLSSWNEVYISDFSTTFTPSGIRYSITGIEAKTLNLSKFKIVQRYANLVGTPLEVLHSLMWILNYKGKKEPSEAKGKVQLVWAEKEPIYQEMDTEEYAKIVREAVKNANNLIANSYVVDNTETETVKERRKTMARESWASYCCKIFERTIRNQLDATGEGITLSIDSFRVLTNIISGQNSGELKIHFKGGTERDYWQKYNYEKNEDGLYIITAGIKGNIDRWGWDTRSDVYTAVAEIITVGSDEPQAVKFKYLYGKSTSLPGPAPVLDNIFDEINRITLETLENNISIADLYERIGQEIHCEFKTVGASGSLVASTSFNDAASGMSVDSNNKIAIDGEDTGDLFVGSESRCLVTKMLSKKVDEGHSTVHSYYDLELNGAFLKKFLDINVPAGWYAHTYRIISGTTIPSNITNHSFEKFLEKFVPEYKNKLGEVGSDVSEEGKRISEEIAKNKASYFKKICIPLGTEESMMYIEESDSTANKNVLTKSVISILNSFCSQCPPKPSAEADEVETFIDENGEEKPIVRYNNYSEKRLAYQAETGDDGIIYVYLFYNSPNNKVRTFRRYRYNSSNTNILNLSIAANSEYCLLNAYSTKDPNSNDTYEYDASGSFKAIAAGTSDGIDFNDREQSKIYQRNKFAYNNINYTGEITILGDPIYKFDSNVVPYSIPIIIEAGYVSGYGAKEKASQYKIWKGSGLYTITKISHSIGQNGFTTTLGIAKYPGIEKDFGLIT